MFLSFHLGGSGAETSGTQVWRPVLVPTEPSLLKLISKVIEWFYNSTRCKLQLSSVTVSTEMKDQMPRNGTTAILWSWVVNPDSLAPQFPLETGQVYAFVREGSPEAVNEGVES